MSAQILLVSLGGSASDRLTEPLIAVGHAVQVVGGAKAAGRGQGQDLLIVDAAATEVAVEACRRVRESAGRQVPILAVAASDEIEDRIALIEAGADDVLGSSFDRQELEALVEALLVRRQPADAAPGQHPAQTGVSAGGSGRLVVFSAAKGGAGTTTLAVNTALVLAERSGAAVAIVDLDLHHGQVATHLDLASAQSTAQLSRDEQLRADPGSLRGAAATHPSGLSVFSAPGRPDEAALVTGDDVIELVETLRRAYPIVVVDAGSAAGSRAMALVAMADQALLVVTPEIPGLRAVHGALEAMTDAGVRGEQLRFVLNQPFASGAIGKDDIERHLGVELALQVPYDGEGCMRAVNEGRPIISLMPRSPASLALRRLAALASDQDVAGDAGRATEPERRAGLLGGLRRRA